MDSSPYLAAIQSLGGITPGDKFIKLNNLANEISFQSTVSDKISDLKNIPSPLVPLALVLIAKKLKRNDLIIDALKSEDKFVVGEALKAKFFFRPSNPELKAIIFREKILPFVSLQTRKRIIKTFSFSLIGYEKYSEDFFNLLVELYGINQAMPLLLGCSETFTYESILKYKVVFPVRFLNNIFRRKPNLVIRYLNLGNKTNNANKNDRKVHKITIQKYISFLPILIKDYIQDFLTLYELAPQVYLKLSNNKTYQFLKNALNVLIQKPNIFLKILNLEIVNKKLTEVELETLYKNLFPAKRSDFRVDTMIDYLKFYPKEKSFYLLATTFKDIYGEDILDNIERLENPDFLMLLPDGLRKEQALKLIDRTKDEKYYYHTYDWRCYLPPKDSIPIFLDCIKKESDMTSRSSFIVKMIYSCHVYDDKNELINVIKYFDERHKNEQKYVKHEFFRWLTDYWIEKLENNHWKILREIIQRAYVKDELLSAPKVVIESLFKGFLLNVLLDFDKKNQDWYNKILNMIMEFEVVVNDGNFDFLQKIHLEPEHLNTLLNAIPKKYSLDNDVWKNYSIKLNVVVNCFKLIRNVNRISSKTFSKKSCAGDVMQIEFKNYSWLVDLTKELFFLTNTNIDTNKRKELVGLLKRHEPEIYKQIIFHNQSFAYCIESGEALDMLKINPNQVMNNWEAYLENAKVGLLRNESTAKRFVKTTKWYKDIPIYFAKRAIENIKDEGYILLLGVLLENQTFSKLATPFIPKESEVDVNSDEAKNCYKIISSIPFAITMVNPPCDLDLVLSFCKGDYLQLALRCLNNIIRRVSIQNVMEFAKRLVRNRVSLKKHGIRIFVQVSEKNEIIAFLTELWSEEKNYSIRDIVASEIFKSFVNYPCEETYNLMKLCLDNITLDEKNALKRISNVSLIDTNYVGLYVMEIFKKIQDLSKENKMKQLEDYICLIMKSINETSLVRIEERTLLEIFYRYFFVVDSKNVSLCIQKFLLEMYLFSTEENFESRLNLVLNILEKVLHEWKTPHPQNLRYYPAKNTFRMFIDNLLRELVSRNFNKFEIVIDKLLNIFSTLLFPWQDPESYIKLNVYKVYLSNPSLKEFGVNCAQQLSKFVTNFSTELILNDITHCLSGIVNDNFNDVNKCKLDLISGLIEGDKFYGTIVGIKLLDSYSVSHYDSRYESIMQSLEDLKDNIPLQYTLNKFLNALHQ